jgi:hypothetical protein
LEKCRPRIGNLPQLDNDDYRLFGFISQTYCFIDLNLRRALEVMHLAKRLPPEDIKRYPNYSDADLAKILGKIARAMDPKVESLDETLFRLEEIGRCRGYRNLVSHFAGKRYPNEDVYIFASKSERDARNAMGKMLEGHRVHFAVAGRSQFFTLSELLQDHQRWLGEKVPEWDRRYLAQVQADA